MVQGLGDVVAHLVRNRDVKGIFFTGSTKTGEDIARVNPLRPMLLELAATARRSCWRMPTSTARSRRR